MDTAEEKAGSASKIMFSRFALAVSRGQDLEGSRAMMSWIDAKIKRKAKDEIVSKQLLTVRCSVILIVPGPVKPQDLNTIRQIKRTPRM